MKAPGDPHGNQRRSTNITLPADLANTSPSGPHAPTNDTTTAVTTATYSGLRASSPPAAAPAMQTPASSQPSTPSAPGDTNPNLPSSPAALIAESSRKSRKLNQLSHISVATWISVALAISSLAAAYYLIKWTIWTAKNDFRESCRNYHEDGKLLTVECNEALTQSPQTTLPKEGGFC